jgi:hypothetical protein
MVDARERHLRRNHRVIVDLATGGGYKPVPESIDMDLASGAVKEIEKKQETKAEERSSGATLANDRNRF